MAKGRASSPTTAGKGKPFVVIIPECPAAEICRAKKADCTVCEQLSEEEWREHVKRVLRIR